MTLIIQNYFFLQNFKKELNLDIDETASVSFKYFIATLKWSSGHFECVLNQVLLVRIAYCEMALFQLFIIF